MRSGCFVALVAVILGARRRGRARERDRAHRRRRDDGGRERRPPARGAGRATAVPVARQRLQSGGDLRRRAPGVVTIYADFGGEGQSQGSGFVVDGKGTILTNAHVVTNVADAAGGARCAAPKKLYVEFRDGDRVPARIVGWDLFSDVAVVKVAPAGHALAPVPLGRLRDRRRREAGGRDRQPVQRAELAVGRRRLGHRPDHRLAHLRLQRLRRDPDGRTDQPGQLGRAALRRAGAG